MHVPDTGIALIKLVSQAKNTKQIADSVSEVGRMLSMWELLVHRVVGTRRG
jgi:hypothetical protein